MNCRHQNQLRSDNDQTTKVQARESPESYFCTQRRIPNRDQSQKKVSGKSRKGRLESSDQSKFQPKISSPPFGAAMKQIAYLESALKTTLENEIKLETKGGTTRERNEAYWLMGGNQKFKAGI